MTATQTETRIYAACLAAYNNGRLHGVWIDCDGKSGDELRQAINEMLAKSPCPNVQRTRCTSCGHIQSEHVDSSIDDECDECGGELGEPFASAEEWAIHDHEGFAGLISSEWPDLDEVAAIAEVLNDDDEDKRRGLFWLVGGLGYKVAEAIERCGDVRTYSSDRWNLAADYAEELASETIENFEERAGQWPFNCIDWERAGRELLLGGDIAEVEAGDDRFIVTNASEF
ncbi:antirestriction protein ArdA [Novosphingobium sp. KN65.2]|uniref:antirestriction protein ArdA n=1 Tax=Novosphingobium sp. KN65.2 TaxID=1478134 RepID=UPI0006D5A1E5|nr:antirestriction protein ArdA [Novosphingobium sp. KN65.2]